MLHLGFAISIKDLAYFQPWKQGKKKTKDVVFSFGIMAVIYLFIVFIL